MTKALDRPPNRIREWRKARGLTLETLAAELDCSIPQLSDLERGERSLTVVWMRRIAAALAVTPADLLGLDDMPGPLSPDEAALLDRLRAAPPALQAQIHRMVEVMLPAPAGVGKERDRAA